MYAYLASSSHKIPEISHRGSNITKHKNIGWVPGCHNSQEAQESFNRVLTP